MFCRIRWQANDYGTIRWQLMVICTPMDAQRIPGVQPGARLLLHAGGDNQVRAVLAHRRHRGAGHRAICCRLSPAYWRIARQLVSRARLPLLNTPPSGTPPMAGREGAAH